MMRGMYSAISGLQYAPDDARRDVEQPGQRQHRRLQVVAHDLQGPARSRRSTAARRRARTPAAPTRPRSASACSSARSTRSWARARCSPPATRSTSPSRATAGSASASATRPPRRPRCRPSSNYTRAGNFIRNDQGYLVTPEGYYVMGRDTSTTPASDAFIQIPAGATGIAIGTDGGVTYVPAGRRPPHQRGHHRRWRSSPTTTASCACRATAGRRTRPPAPSRSARPTARPSARRSAARWRCPTSTSRRSSPT